MAISGIQGASGVMNALGAQQDTQVKDTSSIESFQTTLVDALRETNQDLVSADNSARELVSSQGGNLHETMIAVEKAEIALRFAMRISQKLVQAYQEVSRMQI